MIIRTAKKFKVWDANDGDEENARTVEADYDEAAARQYAEREWAGDPWEGDLKLNVRAPGGAVVRYRITVDLDPTFSATEIR